MDNIPFLPISAPTGFCVIAHRGASAYAPENTRAAFALAQQMGVCDVELDVQLTTDGIAVVCHDETLARYGHGARVVEEMAWSSLQTLDMGSWFSPHLYAGQPMLRLEELFESFGDELVYHVELKGRADGLPRAVHELIGAHGLTDACVVTSFHYDLLEVMRDLAPEMRLGWLVPAVDGAVLRRAAVLGLYQLCPRADRVDDALVAEARGVAQRVRAWGLLGETALGQRAEVARLIQRVIEAGCDGATINWPDWIAPVDDALADVEVGD